jgi:peptide/nickel transport system substrate-binding protein
LGLRRSARLLAAGLALVLGGLAAGCTSSPRTSPSTVTRPSLPKGYQLETSGTVTVGVRQLPTNLNPSTPAGDNAVTKMVMAQVWPQPFVTAPSFDLETSGLLSSAEVHSVSPLSVVYVISPKATWSDGVPITAADFIYDWRQLLGHSASLPDSGLVAGYRDISSIVGSNGGRTVTVQFKEPFSQWQELFSDLPPAHVGEKGGWVRAFAPGGAAQSISGGPFEITSYRPGHELTLSRNPSYWGPAATVAHIRFLLERSDAAMVTGLRNGTIALAELAADQPTPGLLGAGSLGISGLGSKQTSGSLPLAWSGALGNSLWQLCFNFYDPLTANLSLREGVAHALDRSEIVADSEGLVDPRVRVAEARLTVSGETSAAGGNLVAKAPDLYDPAAAIDSFRAAGYSEGAGGLMRAGGSGPPLVLDLLVPRGDWAVERAGFVIQAELSSLGIKVDLERRSLSAMLRRLLPMGDYEMALAPFSVSPTEASVVTEYSNPVIPPRLPSSPSYGNSIPGSPTTAGTLEAALWETRAAAGTEPGALSVNAVTRDISGFDNASVDSYFWKALQALDPPTALSYMEKAEKILWRNVVTIPLFQPGVELIRSQQLENVSESPTPVGPLWNAEDWVILKHVPKSAATTTSAP